MTSISLCPICLDSSSTPVAFHREERLDQWRAEYGDHRPYQWLFCNRCTNLYPSHQPDLRVLQRVWESLRVPEEAEDEEALRRRRDSLGRIGAERSWKFFASLAARPAGKFLDIGCGFGQTVRKFADNGWDAEGIDIDPVTEPYHRKLGIRTRIGPIEQFELASDYSLIQIAHAIYFVTNPMWFIHKIRSHLRPDGLFCVVIADLLAHDDTNLPAYVHTFFPDGPSMRYALALGGFKTIFMKRAYGSIFLAARPAENIALPPVHPSLALTMWRTKGQRFNLIGRPHLALRRVVKTVLARTGLLKQVRPLT